MAEKHKKDLPALIRFGAEDEEPAAVSAPAPATDGGHGKRDIKVYLPGDLVDALDRIALRDFGRGKMRTVVIEKALAEYVKKEFQS